MGEAAVRRIVVGVGPAGRHLAALKYAASEAERRGWGIHLVLVVHPRWPGLDGAIELKLVGEELVRVDADTLTECEQWLADRSGGAVSVTSEIVRGAPAGALVAAGRKTGLIVLQHHRMSRDHHLPTMSITNAVASHADVPVVAVPDGWHEDEAAGLPVIAAVVDVESSRTVAECAAEAARLDGGELRLTRAWSYATDPEVDDPIFATSTAAEWESRLTDQITDGFAGLIDRRPALACHTDVVHGQAAYVLVEASRHARLVVIGRHRPTLPLGSHLGPVTRSVLTHAHCPVMVVDTHPPHED